MLFQNCSEQNFAVLQSGQSASSGAADSAGSVKLFWDANSEPTVAGYKIYYGKTADAATEAIDAGPLSVSNGSVSFAVAGLTKDQLYFFSVVAYDNSKAESTFSNQVSQIAQ